MTTLLERVQQARAREAAQAGSPPSESQPSRLPYSSWLEPAQDGPFTRQTFLERWLADLETPTELNRSLAEKKQQHSELFRSLPPTHTIETATVVRRWTTGCLVESPDTDELLCVGAFASNKPERPVTTALSISLDDEASRGVKSPVKAPASCPPSVKGKL
ncbi:unnamed protein product [Clonostachys byssicola]|uniref:Uncharacterized protein n=1 Tax=Clonostachys byssicola TaxID=160290 RepID=A0A9N9U2R0_9HYPO|nr:unnamed protein product [Clonostachys byssicola]